MGSASLFQNSHHRTLPYTHRRAKIRTTEETYLGTDRRILSAGVVAAGQSGDGGGAIVQGQTLFPETQHHEPLDTQGREQGDVREYRTSEIARRPCVLYDGVHGLRRGWCGRRHPTNSLCLNHSKRLASLPSHTSLTSPTRASAGLDTKTQIVRSSSSLSPSFPSFAAAPAGLTLSFTSTQPRRTPKLIAGKIVGTQMARMCRYDALQTIPDPFVKRFGPCPSSRARKETHERPAHRKASIADRENLTKADDRTYTGE
jgi:hypothetical protein